MTDAKAAEAKNKPKKSVVWTTYKMLCQDKLDANKALKKDQGYSGRPGL